MAHFIAFGILVMALFTALVNIASFLVSESGENAIQDRLTDWYFYIDEGDWSRLVTSSARVTEDFLQHAFGRAFFSWRYFLLTALLGAIILILVSAFEVPRLVSGDHYSLWGQLTDGFAYAVVTSLAAIDVLSLGATRVILRKMTTPHSTNVLVPGLVGILGIGLVAASLGILTLIALVALENLAPFSFSEFISSFVEWSMLAWAYVQITSVLTIPAILSALLLFATLGASWLMSMLRPVARKPLALIVERLAEAPKGLFATLLNGLVIVTAVLVAWKGL